MLTAATPRRARLGVSLMFFTNGVILSSLLPRYPEVKAALDLDNSQFGLLVVGFPLGAVLTAAFAGVVIRRLGTLRVATVGSVLLAAALAVAGTSPTAWLFAAALAAAGALDAVVDAAQNVQGVAVEEWRGRSVINSLHAVWSIGAAAGGAVGAVCAAAEVDLAVQLVVGGLVWSALAVVASTLAVVPAAARPTPDTAGRTGIDADGARTARVPGRPWRLLVPLVVLACCGTLVEDVANNWAVLFLRQETDAPVAVAGLGLTVMLGAQFLGRLAGDPMTDRWGRERVATAGGVLIAVGATLVALSPAYGVALVGFAAAGAGCATLVPAAFAAAARVPGLAEGSGIAIVGWLMRLGFLVTSPSIGVISDHADLRVAMVLPVTAGIVAAVLSHRTGRSAVTVAPPRVRATSGRGH